MKKSVSKRLSDLIESISWENIEIHFGNGKNPIPHDQIFIQFQKRLKTDSQPNYIRLRIGVDIVEKLKWEVGDKILPMFNKDNESIFLLVKPDSGIGFKLAREPKGHAYNLNFKWTGKSHLSERSMSMVEDYEVSKNKLIFQV